MTKEQLTSFPKLFKLRNGRYICRSDVIDINN